MPDSTAETLFDNAKAYIAVASRLMDGDRPSAGVEPAFYLLIGFALELILKTACLRRGVPSRELEEVGHELHKTYLLAVKVDIVPLYMTPFGASYCS